MNPFSFILKFLPVVLLFFSAPAVCEVRENLTSGIDLSAGSPGPSFAGMLIGVNIKSEARLNFGYGYAPDWSIYQVGGKVFLSPSVITGYLGAGINYFSGNSLYKLVLWSMKFSSSFSPFIDGGIDYTADNGFHAFADISICTSNTNILIWPAIGVGWYF